MERRVLCIYAVVLTAALVAAFVQEGGLSLLEPGKVVVLALDVGLVWTFAALAFKARIFEIGRETVRDATAAGEAVPRRRPRAAGGSDSGVFPRPQVGRL